MELKLEYQYQKSVKQNANITKAQKKKNMKK